MKMPLSPLSSKSSARRTSSSSARLIAYREPRLSFPRRVMRALFSPWLLIAAAIIGAMTIGVLGVFYVDYSERVDKLLRGEIFTRSAGIYAAPKTLHAGDMTTSDDIIVRLKRAGYVAQDQAADSERGRYQLADSTLEIMPGSSAIVDGLAVFPNLQIAFDRTGKKIVSIRDLQSKSNVPAAFLEPEQISSVMGENREKRRVIGFRDLPDSLVKAVTVTEDRSFFEHRGINIRGIVRAFVQRYNADPNSPIREQGGSSITQQLVKNLLLSPEKTWQRKFAEAYMSVILETRLSKEEIFALYANEVYLGQQSGFSINGFGEAAKAYFNKDVNDLTLPESAFLAGIIRSPNRYNPYKNLDTATARRNQVLDSMQQAAAVSPAAAEQAKATNLKVTSARNRLDQSEAPYFMDYVQSELTQTLVDANAAQHLRIYTTIDMDLQRAAYAAVNKQLAALDKLYTKRKVAPGTLQAALVAMNAKTGEIIAMVGGRDYEKSEFNRATDAMRQPGSVFKPFVYATALNTVFDPVPRVITAATTYEDKPQIFMVDNQPYAPKNFGNFYSNQPVTLRDALVKSLNVVTVEVANEVTIGRVMNLAAKAGLPRPQRPYLSMALGANEATPMQIASAYTAFANNGVRATPVAINRITTGEGKTVATPTTQKSEVMKPEISYIMTSFMRDVVARGTAAKLKANGFKFNVAGKTGTSRDGWFAGYTPEIVCAVYVGFDSDTELGLTGADSALPIWQDFMTAALTAHPEWATDWQQPNNVTTATIDPRTGGLVADNAPADVLRRVELFVSGTAPTAPLEPVEPEPENQLNDPNLVDPNALPSVDPYNNPAPNNLPLPEPSRYPDGSPLPTSQRPRTTNAPRLEGRGELQPDGTTNFNGSVTVDIDPTTNLLATPDCPVVRTRTYAFGKQPTRYCSSEYHR